MGTSWYHQICYKCYTQRDPDDESCESTDSDDQIVDEWGECAKCKNCLCPECKQDECNLCKLKNANIEIKNLRSQNAQQIKLISELNINPEMPRKAQPKTFEQKLETIMEGDESIDVPKPEDMVIPEPVPPKTPAKRGPKPKVPKKPDDPPALPLVKQAPSVKNEQTLEKQTSSKSKASLPPKTKVIEIVNKKDEVPKKISLVLEF